MIGRTSLALAVTLLTLGLTIGLLGLFDEEGVYARAGLLLSVAAMAPLIVWQSQRAHRATADQLAAKHDAGYRLALEHVARGLLDQPTAPPDGGERIDATEETADHTADEQPRNVRQLFAVDSNRTDRTVADTGQNERLAT